MGYENFACTKKVVNGDVINQRKLVRDLKTIFSVFCGGTSIFFVIFSSKDKFFNLENLILHQNKRSWYLFDVEFYAESNKTIPKALAGRWKKVIPIFLFFRLPKNPRFQSLNILQRANVSFPQIHSFHNH